MRGKILIVEDEGIIAEDIRRILEDSEYTVAGIADSGEDAIKKAEETKPSLVLMDIALRGRMDGVAAAQQIKTRFAVPVIYITTFADNSILERAKLTEPYGYILKPINERELCATAAMAIYKHRMEKELAKTASQFQSVIETVSEGITLSDRSGHFYIYNSMMKAITGYTREEANTCSDFLALLYPESDRYGNALIGITELIQRGRCRNTETTINAKDGSRKTLLISSSLAHDKDREMFLTVYRDITERKRLEEEALKKNYHLVQLGQLSAGIAHEINNPNNTILSGSQMLQGVWEDAVRVLMKYHKENGNFQIGGLPFSTAHEKIAGLPSMITACSRRISDIIENLKDYAGRQSVGMDAEVNINKTIADSFVLLNNQIGQFTDNYSVDLEGNLLMVKGSNQALEQVIINLVMNALESLPDRTRGLRISSSYDDNSGFVIIRIADEGIGMSGEIQDRAMAPFFSTKRDKGGVGLGLSISSAIVKNHGGLLEFSSKPGKGTTAIIKLPALKEGNR